MLVLIMLLLIQIKLSNLYLRICNKFEQWMFYLTRYFIKLLDAVLRLYSKLDNDNNVGDYFISINVFTYPCS